MKPVHEMLSYAAANSPQHIAIKHKNNTITYSQLDLMSERLSLYLRQKGIKKNEPIGIYINKSIDAVVAILAILKSGACYVPLDCSAPSLRINFIIQDAKISTVLTRKEEYDRARDIFSGHSVQLFSVNQIRSKELTPCDSRDSLNEKDLAAILYTSGSTGSPKGAMISHGNLSHFVRWAVSYFSLNFNDRLLGHAPFMFDISFFDIFACLGSGATLILADQSIASNGKLLYQLSNEECITIWQSVPSALTLLNHSNKDTYPTPLSNVRAVLFSGERMPDETLRYVLKTFVNAKFYNVYGCTETNNTFVFEVNRNKISEDSPLPIGRPLPNVYYRIIDDKGHEVDDGVSGHLLVSTPTMMAGYTDDEISKKVFAFKQFGTDIKRKYYYTNDQVVKRKDNNLIFLGRRDSIVKSNGYRVNLMEIELAIQDLPDIEEVAVYAVPCSLIGNRIVAKIRPSKQNSVDSLKLKLACSRILPKYSIPHEFHISSEPLPKNINGKIDKNLLAHHSMS